MRHRTLLAVVAFAALVGSACSTNRSDHWWKGVTPAGGTFGFGVYSDRNSGERTTAVGFWFGAQLGYAATENAALLGTVAVITTPPGSEDMEPGEGRIQLHTGLGVRGYPIDAVGNLWFEGGFGGGVLGVEDGPNGFPGFDLTTALGWTVWDDNEVNFDFGVRVMSSRYTSNIEATGLFITASAFKYRFGP